MVCGDFGLFVFRNDLFVELPSFDNRTLNDPRLQMQEKMCPGIHQLLNKLQMGSEFTELVGSRGQYMLGDYGEILLNTTETYDRISLIMKIDSRVVK